MAKTYVDAVKYLIKIKFQIKGIVDKPDIVGAVFGQSEGLLGEEMDLRELQKKGRVGRIEVSVRQDGGNTSGEIHVPTSMDMAETSVLAAAIETVDKVGPCESSFVTQTIDDVRKSKRDDIAKRAKELLQRMKLDSAPEIDTLTQEIRSQLRVGNLVEYGREKLPAGPDIDTAEEVIVVEGRADVLNLLRHGFKNVIGMGGSKIASDIIALSKRKPLVLFVDGDRGGVLNARKLIQLARVETVAQAPDGKEVEELQQKEIIQALRRRRVIEEFLQDQGVSSRELGRSQRSFPERRPDTPQPTFSQWPAPSPAVGFRRPTPGLGTQTHFRDISPPSGMDPRKAGRHPPSTRGPVRIHRTFGDVPQPPTHESERRSFQPSNREKLPTFDIPSVTESAPIISSEEKGAYFPFLEKVKGKKISLFLDAKHKVLEEVPVRTLVAKLKDAKNVHVIVYDGIITKRLVDAAGKAGVDLVVGVKRGKFADSPVKTLVLE
ncbi:MAG: DNA primase DnaG [Candidatus Diapherotrites archaeon]|nr:DNA primase DnaG [Candidatus Diapherotrites archaeon]